MKLIISATLLALALSACSSPTPVQYYPLPDSAFVLPPKRTQEAALLIILAEPIKTQSLLYQTNPSQLSFAKKHLWVEGHEDALSASLSNKLNRLNRRIRYQPVRRSDNPKNLLKVYIETFQGNYQGYTQITGYAQWANGKSRSFAVQTPQQGDGYPAMVQSLDEGLESVAAEISAR
ncbi:MAG: ABC-type transport auxiliary lipoprotein family protein [Neisseria sp.]